MQIIPISCGKGICVGGACHTLKAIIPYLLKLSKIFNYWFQNISLFHNSQSGCALLRPQVESNPS